MSPTSGDAFAALLDSDVEGAAKIDSGEGVAVSHVAQQIAVFAGRRDLVGLEAPSDEWPLVVADVRRLREDVGWRPSLEADLERHYRVVAIAYRRLNVSIASATRRPPALGSVTASAT
jgi:hypothetical protein